MSFASKDTSQQDSAPVHLYQFNRGSTTWRYCALPRMLTTTFTQPLGGTVSYDWTPEVISSGPIESSGEVPKDSLTILLPITNSLAAEFITSAPDAVTTVTVFRTHYDESSSDSPYMIMIWKGRVLNASASVATVTMTCEPVFTSLRRMGLRETYQRTCRHMLFGPGCNVDPTAFVQSHSVTAMSGATVTVFSVTSLDGFLGGSLGTADGSVQRMILDVSGGTLTLMRPIASLATYFAAHPTTTTVSLYPPCDKSMDTCQATFNNLGNFGGFAGITGINPLAGTDSVF